MTVDEILEDYDSFNADERAETEYEKMERLKEQGGGNECRM